LQQEEEMKFNKVSFAALASVALVATAAQSAGIGTTGTPEWAPGTWQLVARLIHEDNPYADPFDNRPSGLKIMHPDGRFAMMINRPARHPVDAVRIGGRGKPLLADTAHGTWSVDEEARTITFSFEMSTFPSWGREETRLYALRGNRWSYVNPDPEDREDNIYLDWKRLD
jgi:hypothetical protein